ncbi:MAG TPA: hypothetical protein VND22_07035 [Actinomycetota bacterium]|nr:hypothetical protein [Actinomycetota bacterium]
MRLFAGLAALLSVVTAAPGAGVSCVGLSLEQQVAGADLIFVGRIVHADREFITDALNEFALRVNNDEYGLQEMANSHYIFQVEEVWKGKVRKFQRVSQPAFSSISANLDKSRPYTVFARRMDGFVYTDACMGTTGRTLDLSDFGLPKTDPLSGWDMNFSSGQQARSLALNLVFSMVAVHLVLAFARRRTVRRRAGFS